MSPSQDFFDLRFTEDFPQLNTSTSIWEIAKESTSPQTMWKNRTWNRRLKGKIVEGYPGVHWAPKLARVFTIPPTFKECVYLRILLHDVAGPTSFEYLKTIDGIVCDTFRKACLKLGLMKDGV